MFKFLSAAVAGLALSVGAVDAAQVEFRFISEPSVRNGYPLPSYDPEWWESHAGKPISISFRMNVEDINQINANFYWTVEAFYESSGGKLRSLAYDAGEHPLKQYAGFGELTGSLSISTNSDGSHNISGYFLNDTPDFDFRTNWAAWGDGGSNYYEAHGYWQKIANVPLPASLPLLLSGVAAVAALRSRRKVATS